MRVDSKAQKNLQAVSLFALLGSARVKAACEMLVKFTPVEGIHK